MVNQWGSLWSHWLAFKASPSPGFSKIPHSLRVFFRLLSVDQRSSNGRIWRRLVLAVGGGTAWSWILRIKPGCLENWFESFFVGSWDATLWIYLPLQIPFVTFLFLLNREFFATSLEIEQWHFFKPWTLDRSSVASTRLPCKHLLWSPSTSTSSPESIPILEAKKYAFLLKVFLVFMSLLLEGLSGKRVEQVWGPMMIWSYDRDMICDMHIMVYNVYTYKLYIADIHSWILFNHQLRRSDGFRGLSAAAPWFGHDPQTLRGTGGGGVRSQVGGTRGW